MCVTLMNMKNVIYNSKENSFKVEHKKTSETHDPEPSNCSFRKYSVHMKRSFIAKVKSSKKTANSSGDKSHEPPDSFPCKQKDAQYHDTEHGVQDTNVCKLKKNPCRWHKVFPTLCEM